MSLVRFRPEAPTTKAPEGLFPFRAACECSSSGRAPPCQGGGSEFEPRHSLQTSIRSKESFAPYFIRCHSQVVRQSSAKAPRPSSNLGGTSIKITTPNGVVIFMDTEGDFICSGQVNCPCAKVLAFGQNACTAHSRRRPEGRSWKPIII